MGMNPETNRFEPLLTGEEIRKELNELAAAKLDDGPFETRLVRPDGSPVPKHWTVFALGELVAIKGYTFEVKYIGETSILFEPVGPVVVGGEVNDE